MIIRSYHQNNYYFQTGEDMGVGIPGPREVLMLCSFKWNFPTYICRNFLKLQVCYLADIKNKTTTKKQTFNLSL